MYEDQTFDVILQRMLSRVPETMDKRESSPIYAALAPAAVELTSMYIAFDCMLAETFGDGIKGISDPVMCGSRYYAKESNSGST